MGPLFRKDFENLTLWTLQNILGAGRGDFGAEGGKGGVGDYLGGACLLTV